MLEQSPRNAVSIENLPGKQKAAAVLLMMGKELASKLVTYFSKEEMETLAEAVRELPGFDPEAVNLLFEEFGECYVRFGLNSNSSELNEFLGVKDKGTSAGKTATEEKSVAPSAIDKELLKGFFATEPLSVCAILMESLDGEVVAQIVAEMEPLRRNELFGAFLNKQPIAPEVQSFLENEILGSILDVDKGNTNLERAERAADVISYLKDEDTDTVVDFLQKSQPEMAVAIRKSLFKFSMIEQLESDDCAILFDRVSSEDISLSLFGAPDGLKTKVLAVLSQRNQRMVEAAFANSKPPTEKIEAARRGVCSLALKLGREGKISLPMDAGAQQS